MFRFDPQGCINNVHSKMSLSQIYMKTEMNNSII